MAQTNLLTETLESLVRCGKTIKDVRCVTDGKCNCSWEEFSEEAKDFIYDSDDGLLSVNTSLKIIGDTWWLERVAYNGTEWWLFQNSPYAPKKKGKVALRTARFRMAAEEE